MKITTGKRPQPAKEPKPLKAKKKEEKDEERH